MAKPIGRSRKNPKGPRFNKWVIGRAAALFKKGASRRQVAEYFVKKYGKQWDRKAPREMERYISGSRQIFNFFEGKSSEEIAHGFKSAMEFRKQQSEKLKARNQDPIIHARVAAAVREGRKKFAERKKHLDWILWARKEWFKHHRSLATSKVQKNFWLNPAWQKTQRQLIVATVQASLSIKKSTFSFAPEKSRRSRTRFVDSKPASGGPDIIVSRDLRQGEKGEAVVGTSRTPVQEAMERERKRIITSALMRLSPLEKEAVIQHIFEGRSIISVAAILEKPVSEVNTILEKAFKRLQIDLSELE